MTKAPLVEVIDHRREDRSGRVDLPNGGVAWLCGVTVSVDTLRCGHVIEVAGGLGQGVLALTAARADQIGGEGDG